LLAVRPVRRSLNWWNTDCLGDIEYVVDLLNPRLTPDKPIELRIEVINHCQRCNRPVAGSSRLWVEDSQENLPHFSKASAALDEIPCNDRRYAIMNVFPARRDRGATGLPVRLNISLQDPRGWDVPEGSAVVDMPFYAYQAMFEGDREVNILGVGFPGVGKTTFIMSMISALHPVAQQLQNVGGATLEGHTTQMITQYPLADWTENPSLRIKFWDTWGLRPQNFTTDLLTALCEGLVPHGFQMQAYEQGEKQFRRRALSSPVPMDVVLFFMRADQVKHPEGLSVLRTYLNHVKVLGHGAILVVTWLHVVPDPGTMLADLQRRLQIPVLPFTKGCHPNCKVQPASEVSGVAVEKDPEVDKHALVVLEWAGRLATSAARVRTTASVSSNALAGYRSMANQASRFWHWLESAAWGSETAIVLGLSFLALLSVAGHSGLAPFAALHLELAVVPPPRRRELVSSPALRTLLVALSLLYCPVQQSLPTTESWMSHGSTRCARGIDTVQIHSAYSGTSDVTNRKCRDECLNEPECMMYAFGSSEGYFSARGTHCELYKTCEFQHHVGTTVFERPVQSWLVSLSAFAYIAQMVVNFLRLICIQYSGACLMCTVMLCILSVHLCWGAPPTSRFCLMLMLHLANFLALLAMNQHLRERLQGVVSEEGSKEKGLKQLEVTLFQAARTQGASLRDRSAWRAQLDLASGLLVTASTVGFIAYCTTAFSGGEDIWAYNLANMVTRVFVGVQLQALVRACVLIAGTFVLSSPLVLGLRQVQRGLLGLLEDPQAELERSAAIIAVKAFTVQKMLNCLKPRLSTPSEISRLELEEMADEFCPRRSNPDRSALICASAAYFRHGPDEATASAALETMISVRAVDLLMERVDAARISSEMLFARGDFCAELAAAEGDAAERMYSVCNLLFDVVKTLGTGGLYLFWGCRRRSHMPKPHIRAADCLGRTIHRARPQKVGGGEAQATSSEDTEQGSPPRGEGRAAAKPPDCRPRCSMDCRAPERGEDAPHRPRSEDGSAAEGEEAFGTHGRPELKAALGHAAVRQRARKRKSSCAGSEHC